MTRTYNKSTARKKDVICTLKTRYAVSIHQIAKHTKTSVRTARRYIGELIREGAVIVRFKEVRKPFKRPICFYALKDRK